MIPHGRVAILGWAFALTAIVYGSTPSVPLPPGTTTVAAAAAVSSDLVFIPDAGFRKESASNAAAGVDASGTVYLYYQDRSTSPNRQLIATSTDGLSFSAGSLVSYTNRANDSRRTLLPDGTWRLYESQTTNPVITSSRSTDGIAFLGETGTRYAPVTADAGWIGVFEAYTEGSRVILLYLGDQFGGNNLRRAISTDNGVSFIFDQGNILGDAAVGTNNTYVDPKTIMLPDGRRRLFVMKMVAGGTEIDSFISSNGLDYTLEAGNRLKSADFTTVAINSLNDPVVVRLPDGRYRMYVSARVTSTNEFSLVSATTALPLPAFSVQPTSQAVTAGQSASFTVAASGTPVPTYQWQVSTNSGTTWTNLTDTAPYSGSATATLTITSVTTSLTGAQYRAVATNSVGTATSTAATLTVNAATSAPSVTTHPSNQTVTAGASASFSAAASGSPSPTVQWQVSTNSGSTFTNISGATAGTYSFVAGAADDARQFRAVFTNSVGAATSTAATLTVSVTAPTMALDRTSLAFGAVTTGTAFSAQTPAQTVRLTQSGVGTVTWTAASTTPWLVVSPASGSGAATLTITTPFASGLTASQTGRVNLTFTGAGNTAGPITVTLTLVSSTAPVSLPFGVFDTPVGDATVLAGSIAVTGWTLDNIGVQRVELWRDLQAGETTPPFVSTPSDPRNGKVFIANATSVDGARPDVEALYPTTPVKYRAGWGYLLLTWGLWNQGNGIYNLYAFAFDQENNVATIGSKTVVVSNNTATKPFGSIDTPGIGGDASGPNYGWGVTPKVNGVATCKIQASGVKVSIDSGPLQPVFYGDARTDIAGAFPGFSNTVAAGGHFIIDWSTLTTGAHTIGWLITDDCNRADGVGSRFFNVTNGTSLVAATDFRLKAEATGVPNLDSVASAFRRKEPTVLLSRGYGELPEMLPASDGGTDTVEIRQGERIELRLPRGFAAAYQVVTDGQQRDLPTGSTWDAASAIFYWQPAAGFLGRYRIVFTDGTERISVRVIVTPP